MSQWPTVLSVTLFSSEKTSFLSMTSSNINVAEFSSMLKALSCVTRFPAPSSREKTTEFVKQAIFWSQNRRKGRRVWNCSG